MNTSPSPLLLAYGNRGGVVRKGYVTDVITDVSLDWLEHTEETRRSQR